MRSAMSRLKHAFVTGSNAPPAAAAISAAHTGGLGGPAVSRARSLFVVCRGAYAYPPPTFLVKGVYLVATLHGPDTDVRGRFRTLLDPAGLKRSNV